jgi:hypothetical protein
MPIMVGTLAKRYEYDEDLVGDFVCEKYTTDEEYEVDDWRKLDVCLGMVIEAIEGQDEVIVQWVHMCRYHTKTGAIAQTGEYYNNLWEVGQL